MSPVGLFRWPEHVQAPVLVTCGPVSLTSRGCCALHSIENVLLLTEKRLHVAALDTSLFVTMGVYGSFTNSAGSEHRRDKRDH